MQGKEKQAKDKVAEYDRLYPMHQPFFAKEYQMLEQVAMIAPEHCKIAIANSDKKLCDVLFIETSDIDQLCKEGGTAFKQANYAMACERYQKALFLFSDYLQHKSLAACYYNLGRAQQKNGKSHAAGASFHMGSVLAFEAYKKRNLDLSEETLLVVSAKTPNVQKLPLSG